MSHSLCVLAAALLAAQQGGDVDLGPVPAEGETFVGTSEPWTEGPTAPAGDCGCAQDGGAGFSKGGLFSRLHGGLFQGRLRGLFGRGDSFQDEPCCCGNEGIAPEAAVMTEDVPSLPQTAVGEPPLAGPQVSETHPMPPVQGTPGLRQTSSVAMSPGQDVASQDGSGASHRQLVGRIYHLTSGTGAWVLRYGAAGSDRYNGQVILSTAVRLNGFHDGDLVSVRGEILNADSAIDRLGAPLYRASSVEPVQAGR